MSEAHTDYTLRLTRTPEHGLDVAMPRQDNNSTESKVTQVASTATKKCLSLLEINSSQRDTALCSAMLAQSGTHAMVPLIPWLVPGHQRLDARQSPLGASQHAKKLFFKKLYI